jgi:hypothetical protein
MLPFHINKKLQTISSIFDEFVEQINHPRVRAIIAYALDSVRPHNLSLGLRLAKLSTNQIELILPHKRRNCASDGSVLPGVLVSAGLEAFKILWERNFFENQKVQIQFKNMDWSQLRPTKKQVRVKAELSTLARESTLAELNKNKKASQQMQVKFFEEDMIVGELLITADFLVSELIDWK